MVPTRRSPCQRLRSGRWRTRVRALQQLPRQGKCTSTSASASLGRERLVISVLCHLCLRLASVLRPISGHSGREASLVFLPLPTAAVHMQWVAVGIEQQPSSRCRGFILLCTRLWGPCVLMLPGSKRLSNQQWGELRRKLQQLPLPLPPRQPEETMTLPNRCVHESVATFLSKCPAACEPFVTGWLMAGLSTSSTLSLLRQAVRS